jgi:hypothetical protein
LICHIRSRANQSQSKQQRASGFVGSPFHFDLFNAV